INSGIEERYFEADNYKLAQAAVAIEARHYLQATRLEEIRLFAQEMGFDKLGIATCIGLIEEAQTVAAYLKNYFSISVINCKNGGLDKKKFSLKPISEDAAEVMCNPVGQALFLNQQNTDMNIICGLCVGHDMLFTKYSNAPVTTLIVKDRVLAHNPAAVLYSKYYRRRVLGLWK
ncbi:MAG: DUF1847 domain-containing protein, partial [Syntrophomonadaceae bacterium]|nr:DUF1847 domain-containing protein [Syntrophomonadaceae bacterium]